MTDIQPPGAKHGPASDDARPALADTASTEAAALFAGPGEMRARCRAFDWSATPLGPVTRWPQSLRTMAPVTLASAFAKILLWGPELIQIYNDAYIPFLGTKHPWGLGRPTRECWPEVWDFNVPIYERVWAGETVYLEDQLYRLARHGPDQPLDDVYITLSYSPVPDETGAVAGVLVTLIETTTRVQAQRLEAERARLLGELEIERARLAYVFQHAPSFLAVLRGSDYVFTLVNETFQRIIGHRDVLGKPVWEALPDVQGQGFEALLDRVVQTGEPFVGREVPVRLSRSPGEPLEERFIDFVYMPLVEADGARTGVIAHGSDVTDQVLARREVEHLLRESESNRQALEETNARLQEQALELELANQQLQDNAAELEMQAEQLQTTALALEERTEEAEASRQTLTAIVEAVTDGFVAFDDAMRYTFVNGRAEEMWGVPGARLLGKTPRDVWPAAAGSPFVAMFERVRGSGRPEVLEGYATSLGVQIEARAYPAAGGGVVAFFSDITERRRQEEAAAFLAEASQLLASAGDYQTTLRNLASAAVPRLGDWCAVDVLLDPDSPVWPPAIERVAVAHQDPAKLELAQTLTTRFPQDWSRDTGTPGVLRTREPSFIPDVTDAMLAAGAQNEAHLAMLRELAIRSVIIVPLVARDRVLGAITLVMAESNRRFTEADLALAVDLGRRAGVSIDNARLLRDAQEANASKSQFLASMSHELRQPLNAITGYAELMAMGVRGAVTEEQRRDLERIRTSSTHLTTLIGDILEFARIETGQLSYTPTDVRVDAALADVAAFVALQAEKKQQRFTHERCDPGVAVRADPDRFRQVVVNLLTNAIKYTPTGGSVTLSCAVTGPEQNTIAVRVADTGVGIPASKLGAIFDPFVQVHRSLKQMSEGVGLGLAIARDIARHMDGDVTVESEEGVGSTFTLTLPRA
jgi:PAS domain S-box-containing protein